MSSLPKKVSFTSLDEMMKGMLDSQALLAKHLDPATFGSAIATAVSSVLTATIGTGTIRSKVSNGTLKAMKDILIPVLQAGITTTMTKTPKVPCTTIVATRGAPSNPLTIKLAPHESISDFITELPRTSGKIPCLSTWNENILPACVKTRYDAARDLTVFLTCDLIDTAYVYDVDDERAAQLWPLLQLLWCPYHVLHGHTSILARQEHLLIVTVGSYNPILIQKVSSRLLPNFKMFAEI